MERHNYCVLFCFVSHGATCNLHTTAVQTTQVTESKEVKNYRVASATCDVRCETSGPIQQGGTPQDPLCVVQQGETPGSVARGFQQLIQSFKHGIQVFICPITPRAITREVPQVFATHVYVGLSLPRLRL